MCIIIIWWWGWSTAAVVRWTGDPSHFVVVLMTYLLLRLQRVWLWYWMSACFWVLLQQRCWRHSGVICSVIVCRRLEERQVTRGTFSTYSYVDVVQHLSSLPFFLSLSPRPQACSLTSTYQPYQLHKRLVYEKVPIWCFSPFFAKIPSPLPKIRRCPSWWCLPRPTPYGRNTRNIKILFYSLHHFSS